MKYNIKENGKAKKILLINWNYFGLIRDLLINAYVQVGNRLVWATN